MNHLDAGGPLEQAHALNAHFGGDTTAAFSSHPQKPPGTQTDAAMILLLHGRTNS